MQGLVLRLQTYKLLLESIENQMIWKPKGPVIGSTFNRGVMLREAMGWAVTLSELSSH